MSQYNLPQELRAFPPLPRKSFNLRQLFKPQPLPENPLPPTGEMAEYLGKAHSWQDVYDNDFFDKDDLPKIKQYARAYPVTALIGQIFSIQHETEIENALNNLVQQKLAKIDWEPFQVETGAFRKYLIMHFQIAAPPDRTTNQSMGLEIFAKPIQINGFSSDSDKFSQFHKNHMFTSAANNWPEVNGNFKMVIKQATYSNISYPGIGVPSYS